MKMKPLDDVKGPINLSVEDDADLIRAKHEDKQ